MTCDKEKYSLILDDRPLRDVLGELRAQGGRGPSPTGQPPPPINTAGIKIVDSFFFGTPPEGVNYMSDTSHLVVTQPLVVGATQQISQYPTPPNQVVAITHIEFFLLAPLGGGWTRLPDDFAQLSFAFQVMRDGKAPLWQTVNAPGLANNTVGFDMLNQNVLDYFGDAPAYLLYASGSTYQINIVVLNAGIVIPANLRAGVRTGALQIPAEQWKLAAG